MQDFNVVYEDNHLIVVNKRPGLLVQPDNKGDLALVDMVKSYIKEKYEKPGDVFLHAVHRLDRPVSGLVVLARTSKGVERMMELFRKRDIQKTYWAVVRRKPPATEGKLVNWLVKDERKNLVKAYDEPVHDATRAELTYKLLGKINLHYLLEVNPITGRHHQIRAQLAHMGCPIRGDVKYGYDRANADGSINLHARRLFFTHPIKKEALICKASVPKNQFWEEFLELDSEQVKDHNMAIYHFG
jgi:23S rRNA pseudouridine1911/1915/1917 synthase